MSIVASINYKITSTKQQSPSVELEHKETKWIVSEIQDMKNQQILLLENMCEQSKNVINKLQKIVVAKDQEIMLLKREVNKLKGQNKFLNKKCAAYATEREKMKKIMMDY